MSRNENFAGLTYVHGLDDTHNAQGQAAEHGDDDRQDEIVVRLDPGRPDNDSALRGSLGTRAKRRITLGTFPLIISHSCCLR